MLAFYLIFLTNRAWFGLTVAQYGELGRPKPAALLHPADAVHELSRACAVMFFLRQKNNPPNFAF
jgi:hypothetical protein